MSYLPVSSIVSFRKWKEKRLRDQFFQKRNPAGKETGTQRNCKQENKKKGDSKERIGDP